MIEGEYTPDAVSADPKIAPDAAVKSSEAILMMSLCFVEYCQFR